ncbi:MAG TPA: glycosyltransferase [Gammaproteobacteria bacterium]|jgi:glycosyltransferase involved in cell wall biosynthesis|nr:glycosyltransferase [Gammaproteobacteria bacterium]
MTDAGRIRIAQVVASLEVGGAERIAITLAGGLRSYGWDTRLVTLAGNSNDSGLTQPLRVDAERQGVEVTGVHYKNLWDAESRNRLKRYFQDNQIELVHVHNRPVDWQLVVLTWSLGITTLYTRHMVCPDMTFRARWIYRLAGGLAPKTVAVSKVVGEHLTKVEWLPKSKLEVLYNGIDTERFRPPTADERAGKRAELGLNDDDFFWFAALRLDPQKGLSYLLKAISQLPENPYRKIAIAGDGPEGEELKALCKTLNIDDRLSFMGRRQDVSELLWAADAYLCSSLGEGHPIALLEAMSAGVPIIAPRLAVMREIAFDDSAFLYGPDKGGLTDSHDPAVIAEAMLALESNPATLQKIGERGREHVVLRYPEQLTLEAHDELYRRLLADR